MFEGLSPLARDARSWPFEQARSVLARLMAGLEFDSDRDLAMTLINAGKTDEAVKELPKLGRTVLFETGYGPSGLPHIGTFGEVARTTMVRAAFRALTDDAVPTRLVSFSDDMDGLRKVPDNVPNKAMLAEDLGKPLTAVRDPFGEHPSFGQHNNARLRAFLDGFGFDYSFLSSTYCYQSGVFDTALLWALQKFDEIQAVMLPTLREERRATYSCFMPVSPKSGRVLQTPTLERNPGKGTITYRDEDGELVETLVTGGRVKMQWKPDWAMRWAALGIDYEMSGKDLIDSVKASSKICLILGGDPPEGFHYELFLDENNQKISKSKGNGLTMEDWLRYGAPESLAYYMWQSPKSAKRLFFDVIPKASDEYLQQLDSFNRNRAASPPAEGGKAPERSSSEAVAPTKTPNPLDNPVWHVHAGSPPGQGSPVSFSLMLNLVSAANASNKDILWGFLERYIPGATAESQPLLDKLADGAIAYYEDFVRPNKRFRPPSETERKALEDLLARLKALPPGCQDGELIQNEVYAAGRDAGFEPLRLWFQALYEVLLGQSQGPRFGSFAAIYGVGETVRLIERALAGEDLAIA